MSGSTGAPAGERAWLQSFEVRPRKNLGQNFLLDQGLARRIVRLAGLSPEAPVVELGAGGGSLTAALLEAGAAVTAVEIDPLLCRLLRARFAGAIEAGQLCVREGDILETPLEPGVAPAGATEAPPPFLVGNLPYGITTPVLMRVLSRRRRLAGAVFMVQREYGERLLARAGSKAYGSLTVWTAAQAELRLLLRIGRSSFWPRPGVESMVLSFRFPDPPPYRGELPRLSRVLRAAFSQRRKQLVNALAAGLGVEKESAARALRAAGCDPSLRAEVLQLEDYARLVQCLDFPPPQEEER